MLIDPGYLGSRTSSPSYVQYTLIPALIKNAGTMTIDVLVVLKLTMTTLAALETMANHLTIHTIYLPALNGQLNEKDAEEWQRFTKTMMDQAIRIAPIENPMTILAGM